MCHSPQHSKINPICLYNKVLVKCECKMVQLNASARVSVTMFALGIGPGIEPVTQEDRHATDVVCDCYARMSLL